MKTYFNSLCDLDQLFGKKLEEVDKSLYLTESILAGHYRFDFSVLASRRAEARAKILEYVKSKVVVPSPQKKKSGKKKKGELNTIDITLKMLESGMTIAEISKERELVIGTIAGHLAVAVAEGRTSIFSFMTHEEVDTIQRAVKDMPEGFTSKDLFTALKGQYNYAQLRAVMNHMKVVTPLMIE